MPVGFRYNPDHDTIDIGGHNIVPTKKYREALRHGRVAFVVDDVLPPWKPRFIEVRGTAQAEPSGGKEINPHFAPDILRITPTYIVSMGVNDDVVQPGQQRVITIAGRLNKKAGDFVSVFFFSLQNDEGFGR